MKNIKTIMIALATFFMLTGCYKEPDLFEDLLVSNGKVAQIAVVWLGDTKDSFRQSAMLPGFRA